MNLEAAIARWSEQLGPDRVLTDPNLLTPFHYSTIAAKRRIPAVLRPSTTEEIVALVKIAAEHSTPLYPISTGHNWGYGSANPVVNDCVIVDLSDMTAIDASNIELGIITVEPGVTQGMLRAFLDERGLPFLVPVHGGGPSCSLVGNAIERGYGITPYADHFAAVMGLEAVLPNGECYHSALSDLGAPKVDRIFKWGIGPYLDGVFTQSNFGIVTRMSIALAPVPERVETFFFGVRSHEEFSEAVAAIRQVLRAVGNVTGSVNLMNARRVLSMMEQYPADKVGPQGIVPTETIAAMARRARVMPWTGIGAMYGTSKVVKAARSAIRHSLKGVARRLVFVSPARVQQGRRLLEFLPRNGGQRLWTYVSTLDKSLQLIAGSPSEIALPLAYWKSGAKPAPRSGQQFNPAADGCGLIWYTPLVPMSPHCVLKYVEEVERVCAEHGIEPLITLTSLSDRCFDSTVPLLFDRDDPEAAERANACYAALLSSGQALGCVPYRAGINSMHLYTGIDSAHWRLVKQLKTAIDPNNIMAPGRYCPLD
ncbi:FAD-linked oxidase [Ectothiorhodospira sp. BSL-9]|nr:FAD-linked oxidase [Ectothiorhodospira sp. BSL-9]